MRNLFSVAFRVSNHYIVIDGYKVYEELGTKTIDLTRKFNLYSLDSLIYAIDMGGWLIESILEELDSYGLKEDIHFVLGTESIFRGVDKYEDWSKLSEELLVDCNWLGGIRSDSGTFIWRKEREEHLTLPWCYAYEGKEFSFKILKDKTPKISRLSKFVEEVSLSRFLKYEESKIPLIIKNKWGKFPDVEHLEFENEIIAHLHNHPLSGVEDQITLFSSKNRLRILEHWTVTNSSIKPLFDYSNYSDKKLVNTFNSGVGVPGYGQYRSLHISKLIMEFKKRAIDISAIHINGVTSFRNEVELNENKLILMG